MSTSTILLLFILSEVLYFGARFSRHLGAGDYIGPYVLSLALGSVAWYGIASRIYEALS